MLYIKHTKHTCFLSKLYVTRCFSSSSWNFMRVLFLGTDKFSLGTLTALNDIYNRDGSVISQLNVVSSAEPHYNKKKKQLDVPQVISFAEEHNLKTLHWKTVKQSGVFEDTYDLGVVASFGDFIPSKVISLFRKGAINIHPSLLPRWRGAAPIIHTVIAGDERTGISVIEVSKKKFDVGKILHQKELEVPPACDSDELLSFLTRESEKLIPFVINNIDDLLKNAEVQGEENRTRAPKVEKWSGHIDLVNHSPPHLVRLQRGLPKKIGIRLSWNGETVKLGKIINIQETNCKTDESLVGSCSYDKRDNLLWILLNEGSIAVRNLQIENRKEISVKGFVCGYLTDKKSGKSLDVKFENISSEWYFY